MKRLILRLCAAPALLLALIGGQAVPASATPPHCLGQESYCPRVIGIRRGSFLGVRVAPHYGATIVDRLHNGDSIELDCWTIGDADADGHGYRYWAGVYNPEGPPRYVNDWYLASGPPTGPNGWTRLVPPC